MSAIDPNSYIYLNDTPNQIKKKINYIAFSGGGELLKSIERGNIDVDVPFEYLKYFLNDDEELDRYRMGYIKGDISSGI